MTRPPAEHVAEDAMDMTVDELAAAWVEAQSNIERYQRVKRAVEAQLFEELRTREAEEIATEAGLVKLEASLGPYQWDVDTLESEARPLLTQEEWDKALKWQHIPERWEVTVNTTSLKAALSKKGKQGRDVLEKAGKREQRDPRIKVVRDE